MPIAAVAFAFFIWIERPALRESRRPTHDATHNALPLIDLTLFRRRNFSPAVFINFLVGGVLIIAMVNVPLVINVLEFDVETAALHQRLFAQRHDGSDGRDGVPGGPSHRTVQLSPGDLAGAALCALGFGIDGQ
jgi:hypothetical protein